MFLEHCLNLKSKEKVMHLFSLMFTSYFLATIL